MKFLQRFGAWLRRRWKLAALLAVGGGMAVVLAFGQLSGLYAFERYRGFFAPVWSADGRQVYYLERKTAGFVWGPGWEFFTPPASTQVVTGSSPLE